MLKKEIIYTDYDGNEKTGEYHFHLSKKDLMEMEFSTDGGMQKTIERIVEKEDVKGLAELIKEIILKSYGELTEDDRFIKVRNGHKLSEDFEQTEAFSELYFELNTNENALVEFVNGVIPANLRQEIAARG